MVSLSYIWTVVWSKTFFDEKLTAAKFYALALILFGVALLGNYNIFPGDVLNARSEDILNALDAAYEDGFDVANMSLGGNAHGIQDLLTVAVDNLDQANMVVAVAAGNSGPGLFTVESPGYHLAADIAFLPDPRVDR